MPTTTRTITYSEMAEECEVRRSTIADLMKKYGLRWEPIRENGRAKGIRPADARKIRRALNMKPEAVA